MKKMKITLGVTAFIFVLTVSLLSFQAHAGWMVSYYKNNPMTVEELKSNWGEPANIVSMENGVEKMVFGPKDVMIGYTYFLVKEGMVINRGTTDSLGKSSVSKAKSGPVAKTFMGNYYKANPVSEDALRAQLGKPVAAYTYENGITRLYYGPKDVEIGYTTYLIKDGMVIDKNSSHFIDKKDTRIASKGPEAKGFMANYYKANPTTVEQLKAQYGSPISNHDYENGVSKLTFGPKDVVIGYTYFLVKDGMVIDKRTTGN